VTLGWGRRYLMCPPDHFEVAYEINPWMHREVRIDPVPAVEQWHRLHDTLVEAGATVDLLVPVAGVPDLVFTANAGLVNGDMFVPARFRHAERQAESSVDVAWFESHGYRVVDLPAGMDHEGAGDALPFGGALLSAYRFRSDLRAATELTGIFGCPVRSVELVDQRLYHLDLTFCPLDEQRAICAPSGWDDYGRRVVADMVPERLDLDEDEALGFCANSVVVGTTVVMPDCTPRVGSQLERWGFDVVVCPVGEFLKAGGGCRCLTLALDVTLGPAPEGSDG
jgi:N-dimethylarginine dimethylaminohydrolase